MKREGPLAVVLILGLLYIAANYFTGIPALATMKTELDGWQLIVAAWAAAVGLINVTQIHSRNIMQKREGWPYSVWMLICAYGMLLVSVFVFKSPNHTGWKMMYGNLIAPLRATVYSTVMFYIASAAYRAFRIRNVEAGILLFVALIMMLGRVPLGTMLMGGNPFLGDVADWLLNIPNSAGMRGIEIGACLGGIATAFRILIGLERNWLGGGAGAE